MSLRDQWLADPEPGTYSEWLRRRTVPPLLLVLQPAEVNAAERVKAASKPRPRPSRPRKSRANPNGKPLVHGTTQGRKRHLDYGEEVCAECVVGHEKEKARRAADKRRMRADQGAKKRVAKCGTPYMADKHRARGEVVDEECLQSERDEWRKRQSAA